MIILTREVFNWKSHCLFRSVFGQVAGELRKTNATFGKLEDASVEPSTGNMVEHGGTVNV